MKTATEIFDEKCITVAGILSGNAREIITAAIQAGIDAGENEKGFMQIITSFRDEVKSSCRPIIGIAPQNLWVEQRIYNLNETIKRLNYTDCGELIEERNEHERWLAARRVAKQTGNIDKSKDGGTTGQRQETYPG